MNLDQLLSAVAQGYGIRLVKLDPLEGGLDSSATTYRGGEETGREFFIKHKARLDPGIALCAALGDLGHSAVVRPVKTLSGESVYPTDGGFLLLYPFLGGCNGFERPLELAHWQEVGGALRRIHDASLPDTVLKQLKREDFHVEGTSGFRAAMGRLLAGDATCESESALADVLLGHRSEIEQTLNRVEALGQECHDRKWEFVPCHGDLHFGNVLIGADGGVHIVDWDAPRLAPRECDLIFFTGNGVLGCHTEDEEANFYTRYGPSTPDLLGLTYYRYARALEDFVAFAREASDQVGQSLEERMAAVRYFEGLFGPRQIVETAMQSDARLLRDQQACQIHDRHSN